MTTSRIATLIAAIAMTFALGSATALADTGSKTSAATKAPLKSKSKAKVKTLIFGDGDELEGGFSTPDGENLSARGTIVYSSLIRVREHFVAEIFKSAENL